MENEVGSLFTPERYDAALTFLGRILGCSMKALWTAGGGSGGTCSDANDLVATLAKTLNIGMLAIIAVVATYLIFASIKNTALDGQAGGRSMNPGWTLVMAAIAAILSVPLSSGFSALQIGVMQTAVWSSGFGDTVWKTSYEKMFASSANVASVSSGQRSTQAATDRVEDLRGQVAVALGVKVVGEICTRELSQAVTNMTTVQQSQSDRSAASISARTVSSSANGTNYINMFYEAGTAFGSATGLCGRIQLSYPSEATNSQLPANRTDQLFGDEASRTEIIRLIDQASRRVSSSVAQSLSSDIAREAATLANALVPSDAPAQLGTQKIELITQAIDRIMNNARTKAQSGIQSLDGQLGQAISKAMADGTRRGWLFAVLYQRVLVNATTAQAGVGNGVAIESSAPEQDLAALMGCRGVGGVAFWRESCAEVQNIFMARMATTMGNYELIKGAFDNAATNSPVTGSNSTSLPGIAGSQGRLSTLSQRALSYMTGTDEITNTEAGEGWVDPIPQIQSTGGTMMAVGGSLTTLSALGGTIGKAAEKYIPFVGSIAAGAIEGFATLALMVGGFLFFVGFILAVIIPMLPMVYFFAAGLSWLVSVCMAIFTAPFYLMQMFYPNQHGGLNGTGMGKALVLLVGIIVRPAMLVVGLLLCMVLMRAGLDIWNIMARNAFAAFSGAGELGRISATMTDIVSVASSFVFYSIGAAGLVIWCCQFISGLPDAAMEAIEAGSSRLFADSGRSQLEAGMAGAAAGIGARAVPQLTGRSLSGVAKKLADGRRKDVRQIDG